MKHINVRFIISWTQNHFMKSSICNSGWAILIYFCTVISQEPLEELASLRLVEQKSIKYIFYCWTTFRSHNIKVRMYSNVIFLQHNNWNWKLIRNSNCNAIRILSVLSIINLNDEDFLMKFVARIKLKIFTWQLFICFLAG